MRLFKEARIRLTVWYLLIIMFVSISFSAFIYSGVSREFQQRLNVIERRFSVQTPLGFRVQGPVHEYFLRDLEEARKRVVRLLLYTNGVIFVVSAAAGYLLAGKTLKPIESAMNEQKRFISDSSHELKTPLTALQTSIEVALRDKKLKLKDAKIVLMESLDDVESLKNLANDLLSLTRYQQNGQKLNKEKVNLKVIVGKAGKRIEPLAKKKKLNLSLKVNKYSLYANPDDLEKLLTILLDNAVKYTAKGGTVSLSVNSGRRNIVIKIKDTGVGISEEDLPHIFDRFYRADLSRTKTKVDGFGLGLSMAKKIVDLHAGKISAISVPNKGSTFVVKLPR